MDGYIEREGALTSRAETPSATKKRSLIRTSHVTVVVVLVEVDVDDVDVVVDEGCR